MFSKQGLTGKLFTIFFGLNLVFGACADKATDDTPEAQREPSPPSENLPSQDELAVAPVEPNQNSIQKNLVDVACVSCHSTATSKNRFVELTDIGKLIEDGSHSHTPNGPRGNLIKPGCPRLSFFLTIMKEGKMPPAGRIPEKDLLAVENWIIGLKPDANCNDDEPGDNGPGEGDEPGVDDEP